MEIKALEGSGDAPWLLSRAVQVYVADVRGRTARSHWERERLGLETVLGSVGDPPLEAVTLRLALQYRAERLDGGASRATANHETSALRRCLGFATQMGLIGQNPLRDLKELPVKDGHRVRARRAFSPGELARFMAAARIVDTVRRRAFGCPVPQRPVFAFLAGCGARKGEALRLRWGHLRLELDAPGGLPELDGMGVVTMPAGRTKSRKARVVPLDPETAAEMVALRRVHEELLGRRVEDADPLFRTGRGSPIHSKNSHCLLKTFNAVLEEAGIAKANVDGETLDLHALRVTYNTRLARAGVELGARQALMGHSDPRLTERVYTDRDLSVHVGATHKMVLHELRDLGIEPGDAWGILAAVGIDSGPATREEAPAYGRPAAEKANSSRGPLTEAASVAEGEGMEMTTSAKRLRRPIRERSQAARICNPSPLPLGYAASRRSDQGSDEEPGRKPAAETSTDELLAQARRLSAEGLREAAAALYEAAVRSGGRA